MGNKKSVLFWRYGWERTENISAENDPKHLSNSERNEGVIRALFVLPPAIPAEHKGTAERIHESIVWKSADSQFLPFFFCPGSAAIFPHVCLSPLPPLYYNVQENSI